MMATVGIIESLPTIDDVFDAEVDDDIDDGGLQVEPSNNEDNSVDDENPLVIDDLFDDEGSPQASNDESDREEEAIADDDSTSTKQTRERSPKPRKLKKAAIQSIHSECQKMLRESRIKLPYYQPAVRPITHFLKRVPNAVLVENKSDIKTTNRKSNKESAEEPSKTVEEISTTQPELMDVIISDSKTHNKITTPKLSDATDPFFFDETPTVNLPKKGIQNLMQRFAKHTSKPKVKSKKDESIVIVGEQNDQSDGSSAPVVQPPKKLDKIPPGRRLQALKEQLEVKMKKQRAEMRKIHESQRKLDNEEITDEEEEEAEMTDESDSDYELDKWNEADERKQEEVLQDDDDQTKNEFFDDEADEADEDGDSVALEDNSGSDGDISDEGNSDDDDDDDDNDDVSIHVKVKHSKHHKVRKHKKSKEKFLSKPTSANEEETLDLFNINSNSQTCSEGSHILNANEAEDANKKQEGEQSLCLRLDSIEDDEGVTKSFTKTKDFKSPDKDTDTSLSIQTASDSDLTNESSRIEPAQRGGGERSVRNQESDPEFSSMLPQIAKRINLKQTTQPKPKKTGKLSQLTLPIEDSQDLFDEQTLDNTEVQDKVTVSNGFSFGFDEETQFSQMLDTQGFLFSSKKQEKPNPSSLFPASLSKKSDMEEILGLCSGQFTATEPKPDSTFSKRKPRTLLGALIPDENAQSSNMDELLGLCSGMFGSKDDESSTKPAPETFLGSLSRTADNKTTADSGDEDDSKISKDVQEEGDVTEGDEKEEEDDGGGGSGSGSGSSGEESDVDMDELRKNKKYKKTYGSKPNKIFDKKKFYEEEAELSGSDVGSDADEDIDTDDDILEEDSEQEELPPDEELKNQITKVYMKSILDQEKAELRLMQDIYLADGDLHGEGRKRNFKWRGIDFNSQADLFGNRMWNDDDNANIELLTEEECKKRKEKFERDTFLREEMQKGSSDTHVDLDENSQVILNFIKDTSNASPAVPDQPKPVSIKKPSAPASTLQRKPSQKGSFLNRSKATLTRLSSITANTPNTSSSGRSFVFKTVEVKSENTKKMPRTMSMIEPAAKRPKFDRTISDTSSNSIFSML